MKTILKTILVFKILSAKNCEASSEEQEREITITNYKLNKFSCQFYKIL